MSQEAGKLVVVWLSRHAALLPNKGGALRDETITAAKETPIVVSSPGAGETPDFKWQWLSKDFLGFEIFNFG